MSSAPYEPPTTFTPPGPILQKDNSQLVRNIRIGFLAYCGFMACLYLACVLGAISALFVIDFEDLSREDRVGSLVGCILLGVMSFPLAMLFGFGPFLPRKNWAWIYGIVLIAIGLTSPCCMPVSIPLLIFWIKPEIRAYYFGS